MDQDHEQPRDAPTVLPNAPRAAMGQVRIRKGGRWLSREENLLYGAGARADDETPRTGPSYGRPRSGNRAPAVDTEEGATKGSRAAAQTMRSSSWTGRQSLDEQLAVIRAYAPVAAVGAAELIEAIGAARLNDPSAEATLRALKDLHSALGDLITRADAGFARHGLHFAWEAFERKKGRLIDAIEGGAQAILVAPTVAFGTATVLSLMSGEPITGEMLAILTGAIMAKGALIGKRT